MDCVKCQGRLYSKPLKCGHSYCPIFSKVQMFQTKKLDKAEFLGTAPSVFVGRHNYPNLNVGILAPPDRVEKDGELYDSPSLWSKRNFAVDDVLKFRGSLINSRFEVHIKSKPRFLEMTQEVAMSSKPVDVEFKLEKKPRYQYKSSDVETIMGATASLRKAMFQSNPKIDKKVDYVVSDDLNSVEALNILYKKGYDETFLNRILSVGTLGLKTRRKLVPTRWSITAVDDTLGKSLITQVKDFKESDYRLFYGGYLGNYFLVLFFPRVWSYELFEMYMPSSLLNPDKEIKHTTDHELYSGRKSYAENCVGGYYASRLSVLNKMKEMKRQAATIVLRFTTEEYNAPLGVWVVREAVKKAMHTSREFNSEKEMLDYAREVIKKQFNYNINSLLNTSKVLSHIKNQRTIKDYF